MVHIDFLHPLRHHFSGNQIFRMNKNSRPSRRRVSVLDASPRVGDPNFGTNDAPWPKGGICWGRNKMIEKKRSEGYKWCVNIGNIWKPVAYMCMCEKNMLFRELIYFWDILQCSNLVFRYIAAMNF